MACVLAQAMAGVRRNRASAIFKEAISGARRLGGEYIEASTANLAVSESIRQRLLIDECAAGSVDQRTIRLHPCHLAALTKHYARGPTTFRRASVPTRNA